MIKLLIAISELQVTFYGQILQRVRLQGRQKCKCLRIIELAQTCALTNFGGVFLHQLFLRKWCGARDTNNTRTTENYCFREKYCETVI